MCPQKQHQSDLLEIEGVKNGYAILNLHLH